MAAETKLYVNAGWTSESVLPEGLTWGENAFNNLNAAAKVAPVDEESIIVLSGTDSIASESAFGGGQDVTIEGTATIDWNSWMMIGRDAGQGDVSKVAYVTFDNATIARQDPSSSGSDCSIHISGAEKGSSSKGYGQLDVVNNSNITTEWVINKNVLNVNTGSTFTAVQYLNVAGRPASETPSGEDYEAVMTVDAATVNAYGSSNGSGLVIGNEGKGTVTLTNGAVLNANTIVASEKSVINVTDSTVTVGGTFANPGAFTNSGTINISGMSTGKAEFSSKIFATAFSGANGTITVDMNDATESSYKLIDITGTPETSMTLADYGTVSFAETETGITYFANVKDNDLYATKAVASITDKEGKTTYFASLKEAYAAAKSGDVINLLVSEIDDVNGIPAGVTLKGEADYTTVSTTLTGSVTDATFINLEFVGSVASGGAARWLYGSGEQITFDNCIFNSEGQYGIHFDELTADLKVKDCAITGTVAISATTNKIEFEKCEFNGKGLSGYCNINFYSDATFTGCTFTDDYCTGSARGILTLGGTENPAVVELIDCSLAGEASVFELNDVFRRDHLDLGVIKDAKGTVQQYVAYNAKMIADYDGTDVSWIGDSTKFVYTTATKDTPVTVSLEGTAAGLITIPEKVAFTLEENAAVTKGTVIRLATNQGSEEYIAFVASLTEEQAANCTIQGWCCSIGSTKYYTLQEAVDAASTETVDTIKFFAEYESDTAIHLTKKVNIVGEAGNELTAPIVIDADGAGSTITGINFVYSGIDTFGEKCCIYVNTGVDTAAINGCTFTDSDYDPEKTPAWGTHKGIITSGSGVDNLTVKGSTFTGFETAVYLNPNITNAVITGNKVDSCKMGIRVNGGDTIDLSSNTYTNCGLPLEFRGDKWGDLTGTPASDVSINGSKFSGSGTKITAFAGTDFNKAEITVEKFDSEANVNGAYNIVYYYNGEVEENKLTVKSDSKEYTVDYTFRDNGIYAVKNGISYTTMLVDSTYAKDYKEFEPVLDQEGYYYSMNAFDTVANATDAAELLYDTKTKVTTTEIKIIGGEISENAYFNGYKGTIDGADLTAGSKLIYGGANDDVVESTSVTIENGGKAYFVYGGSSVYRAYNAEEKEAEVAVGNTRITITGEDSFAKFVYGGSQAQGQNPDTVNTTLTASAANTEIIVEKGAEVRNVYGGSMAQNSGRIASANNIIAATAENTSIKLDDATANILYGGGRAYAMDAGAHGETMDTYTSTVTGKAAIVVNGTSSVKTIYAGGEADLNDADAVNNAEVESYVASAEVTINGGTVGNIYAGGEAYNGKTRDNVGSVTANVGSSVITINGGTVGNIYGSGNISGDTGKTSVADVDNAALIYNGGTITGNINGFDTISINKALTAGSISTNGAISMSYINTITVDSFTSIFDEEELTGCTISVDMTGAKEDSYLLIDVTSGSDYSSANLVFTGKEADKYSFITVDGDLWAVKGSFDQKYVAVDSAWTDKEPGEIVKLQNDDTDYEYGVNAFDRVQTGVLAATEKVTIAGRTASYGDLSFSGAVDGLTIATDGDKVIFDQFNNADNSLKNIYIADDSTIDASIIQVWTANTLTVGADSTLYVDGWVQDGYSFVANGNLILNEGSSLTVKNGFCTNGETTLNDATITILGGNENKEEREKQGKAQTRFSIDRMQQLNMNGHSSITLKGWKYRNGEQVTMDATSQIVYSGQWNGEWYGGTEVEARGVTVTVDAADNKYEVYKIVDYTGSEKDTPIYLGEHAKAFQDKFVFTEETAGYSFNFSVEGQYGDVYVFANTITKVIVNSNYGTVGYAYGDAIIGQEGYFYGINAFESIDNASAAFGETKLANIKQLEITGGAVNVESTYDLAEGAVLVVDKNASLNFLDGAMLKNLAKEDGIDGEGSIILRKAVTDEQMKEIQGIASESMEKNIYRASVTPVEAKSETVTEGNKTYYNVITSEKEASAEDESKVITANINMTNLDDVDGIILKTDDKKDLVVAGAVNSSDASKDLKLEKVSTSNLVVDGAVAGFNDIELTNKGTADQSDIKVEVKSTIAAKNDLTITNADSTDDTNTFVTELGVQTHTAQNDVTINNGAESKIIGTTKEGVEIAANVKADKNVTITNKGHMNANVTAGGDMTITNSSANTLIGDYAGQNVSVTNTATGAAENVTLQAYGTALANPGTVTVTGEAGSVFSGNTLIVAGFNATPEDITKNTKLGSVRFNGINKFTGTVEVDAQFIGSDNTAELYANTLVFDNAVVDFNCGSFTTTYFKVEISGESSVSINNFAATPTVLKDNVILSRLNAENVTIEGSADLRDGVNVTTTKDLEIEEGKTLALSKGAELTATQKVDNAGSFNVNASSAVFAGDISNSGTMTFEKAALNFTKTLANSGVINIEADETEDKVSTTEINSVSLISLNNAGVLNIEAKAELKANYAIVNAGTINLQVGSSVTGTAINNTDGTLNWNLSGTEGTFGLAADATWVGSNLTITVDNNVEEASYTLATSNADAVAGSKFTLTGAEIYDDVEITVGGASVIYAGRLYTLTNDSSKLCLDVVDSTDETLTLDKKTVTVSGQTFKYNTLEMMNGSSLTINGTGKIYAEAIEVSAGSNTINGVVKHRTNTASLTIDEGATLNVSAEQFEEIQKRKMIDIDGTLSVGDTATAAELTWADTNSVNEIKFNGAENLKKVSFSNTTKITVEGENAFLVGTTAGDTFTFNKESSVTLNSKVALGTGSDKIDIKAGATTTFTQLLDLGTGSDQSTISSGSSSVIAGYIDNNGYVVIDPSALGYGGTRKLDSANTVNVGSGATANFNAVDALTKLTLSAGKAATKKAAEVRTTAAFGGDVTASTNISNTYSLGNYTDTTFAGKITFGEKNDTVKIGSYSTFAAGNVNFDDGSNTVTLGTGTTATFGAVKDLTKLTLSAGKAATSKADQVTTTIEFNGDVTASGDLANTYTFNKYNAVTFGGDIDFGAKNDKISIGTDSSFKAGNIMLDAGTNTVNIGARSTADFGTVNDLTKLTVSAGKDADQMTTTTFEGINGSAELANTYSFGNWTFTEIKDAFGVTGVTFGEKNDTLKIGSDSSFTAGAIDFAEGKNTLSIGARSSFTATSVADLNKFTVTAGTKKSGEITVTEVNISKDVTGTSNADTFSIGNYSDVNIHGEIDFGDDEKKQDTLTVGNYSTVVLKVSETDSLKKFTIGKESTAFLSSELKAVAKLDKTAKVYDIGFAEYGTAQVFTSREGEVSDNTFDNAVASKLGETVNGWLSDETYDDTLAEELEAVDSIDFVKIAEGAGQIQTSTNLTIKFYDAEGVCIETILKSGETNNIAKGAAVASFELADSSNVGTKYSYCFLK